MARSSRTVVADFRLVMPVTTASGNRVTAGSEGDGVASADGGAADGDASADALADAWLGVGATLPHPATTAATITIGMRLRNVEMAITSLS
jgi:hypothetical protein